VDFAALSPLPQLDEVYLALGTTIKAAGSQAAFRAVDCNATFTVKLSAASGQTIKVKYATGGGTATSGTDYTALALTTLTFSPGQTSKTVSVPVKGDLLKEANETFFVNLSGAVNAAIGDAQGLGTILNDD